MRKSWKYFFIGVVVLVLISTALISLVIWALNTAEGTRVLLKAISTFSPVRVEAREISGRLRDDLKMRGLRILWPRGEMTVDFFHLRWQPTELWNRTVIIHELSLDGVHLQDNRPESKEIISFPGWPMAPFWLTRLQGRFESFQVGSLIYRRLKQNPDEIKKIFARVHWDGETLTVSDFTLASPQGEVEGVMRIGFVRPDFSMKIQAAIAKEYAGFNSFLLQLRLNPGGRTEEASGDVLISAGKKGAEGPRFEGDLRLTRTVLKIDHFRSYQPGRKGIIRGEGQITFGEKPILQLKADFAEWNLAPELGRATDLSGKLDLKGSLNDYQGQIFIANRINGWQGGQSSATFRGNQEHLEITSLDAAWLNGSLKGPLKISWVDGISLQGKLQGRKLSPALFNPDWKGEINLNLDGKFLWPKTQVPEAAFKADLLPSRLFDRTVTGDLAGSLKKNLLRIGSLHLKGHGFDLQARGALQEKVTLEAHISDLSGLIPEAQGQISATGWLRFGNDRLSGSMTAQGKDLSVQTLQARAFLAELHLKEFSPQSPPVFSVEARGENLQAGPLPMESASLNLTGTPAAHQALLALRFTGGEIQGEVKGAYDRGSWKGSIEKLNGADAHGLWSLQRPARVIFSPNQFQLAGLSLQSTLGEKLQVNADLSLNPILGSMQAKWETMNLARANPWLPQGNLSGRANGSFSVDWEKKGSQVSGKTNLKGTFAYDRLRVEVPSGQVKLDWNEKGLLALAALKINPGGTFDAKISSTESFQPTLPKEGKLEAQWKALDLGILLPLLPEDLTLKGQNSGNLNGQWFPGLRFDAVGAMKVSQGQVTWKGGEKPISTNLTRAEMDFAWRGESMQGNVSLSCADYGWLKGTFLLPLSSRISPSFRSDGPLKVSVQGELQEKGLLAKVYPKWIQESRGKIEVNVNAEGTWGEPRFKGALQISDTGIQLYNKGGPGKSGEVSPPLILEVSSGAATMDWGAPGLMATLNMALNKNGRIDGQLSSSEPARFALPKEGKVDLSWTALNLAALQPLLPEKFFLEGQASGQVNGKWLPGLHLDIAGGFNLSQGIFSWRGDSGLITARLNQSAVDFLWRGERLQGNVNLALMDYGSLKGNFFLPLPAHPPFQFDSAGPVKASFQGQAQERGLLSALFPGMVQETRGKIDFSFTAEGTWGKPLTGGTLQLTDAGAYLPTLGIRMEDVSSRWKLRGEQIQVESLAARSGSGRVEGTGAIWLKNWKIERYQGSLTGEKFQIVYRPDLRIQSNPRLSFQGTPQHLTVRGEILIPEAEIYQMSAPGVVRPQFRRDPYRPTPRTGTSSIPGYSGKYCPG